MKKNVEAKKLALQAHTVRQLATTGLATDVRGGRAGGASVDMSNCKVTCSSYC